MGEETHQYMSKNNSGQWIGGLLLGTALGTITGILMAPRSGQQTRQLLKKSAAALPELAEDLSSSLQWQADRLSESTKDGWEGTLSRLREAIAAGVEAGLREREDLQVSSAQADSAEEDNEDIGDRPTDPSPSRDSHTAQPPAHSNTLDS